MSNSELVQSNVTVLIQGIGVGIEISNIVHKKKIQISFRIYHKLFDSWV